MNFHNLKFSKRQDLTPFSFLIVTDDPELAERMDTVLHMKDGLIGY